MMIVPSERDARAASVLLWIRTHHPDLGPVRLAGGGAGAGFIVLPKPEDDDDLAAEYAVAERRRLEAKEREPKAPGSVE